MTARDRGEVYGPRSPGSCSTGRQKRTVLKLKAAPINCSRISCKSRRVSIKRGIMSYSKPPVVVIHASLHPLPWRREAPLSAGDARTEQRRASELHHTTGGVQKTQSQLLCALQTHTRAFISSSKNFKTSGSASEMKRIHSPLHL